MTEGGRLPKECSVLAQVSRVFPYLVQKSRDDMVFPASPFTKALSA